MILTIAFVFFLLSQLSRGQLQSQSPRNCSYLATVQNLALTPKVRGILIDWLVEVALEFEFQDETLYLSVALVDQALSKFRVSGGSCP